MADDKDGITVSNPLPYIKAFADTKAGKITITTVLILIPLILGFLIRAQPLTGENLDRIAQSNVDRQLTQQFAQQVQLNNSNLGQSQIRQQAQRQVQSYKAQNPDQYQQRVGQVRSQVADQFSKPDGEPYLIAIDPYYYWRQAQNQLDHGYQADTIKNGTPWNTYKLAPIGTSQGQNLHPTIAAWASKTANTFSDVSTYLVFFILPALIGPLAGIPAYFLGRRVGGRLGGFIAAMITVTHQVYVSRSVAGFVDTDAYVITLPLFIFWFAVEALTATKTKNQVTWTTLTALTSLVFSNIWQGWWLTYIFFAVAGIATLVHIAGRQLVLSWQDGDIDWDLWSDQEIRSTTWVTGGLLVGTLGVINLTGGIGPIGIIQTVLDRLAIGSAAKSSLWPNVFTTVAELGGSNFNRIIQGLGSNALFYTALASTLIFFLPSNIESTKQRKVYYSWLGGSLFSFSLPFIIQMSLIPSLILIAIPILSGYFITMFEERERVHTAFPVFLTAWIIATLFATTQGTRFNMILLAGYAVALGTGIGWVFNHFTRLANEYEGRDATYSMTLLAGIVLLIGLSIPYNVQADGWQAGGRLPSMNDAWYDSLQGIEERSDEDAIITSWWDFGHWFKEVADRRVTFDGGSQNTPNAHWVGRALQTSDEDEAKSILRMLHCGNFKGYEKLLQYKHDVSSDNGSPEAYLDTKQTMDEALTINEQSQAVTYYDDHGLTQDEATTVANLTHCNPPENYFITSDDMVGKSGVWSHFGLWDFGRAYAVETYDADNPQETINRYAENINISQDRAQQYYLDVPKLSAGRETNQWISPYPSYATNGMRSCTTTNESITCDIGLNLGQQRRGQRAEIEELIVPRDNKANATFILGIYDTQNQFRQGQQELNPASVSIGQDGSITTHDDRNGSTRLGTFLHESQEGQWQVLLADPELTTSMFTRLYLLDGAYTDDFEKVSDEQSPVSGNRIKVWKPNLTNNE